MNSVATKTPARKPRKKAPRTLKVLIPLAAGPSVAVLRVTEGRKVDDYCLWRQPSDIPGEKGFRLLKLSDESHAGYDVRLTESGPACECKGHLRHGHCRHGELLLALDARGKL